MSSQKIMETATAFLRGRGGRFILVGVVGAIVELGLFSGLMNIGLGILSSNFVAFHCAFALCFYLHYCFTHQRPYEGTRFIASGFVKYAGLMYAQLAVGSLLLWFLIDELLWVPEVAKLIQIGVVTPASYAVQKFVIFRARCAL